MTYSKNQLLGPAISKGYRPSTLIWPAWFNAAQAQFTLTDVEIMRRDPQVSLCLRMLKAPFYTAEWAVKCPRQPAIAKFVNEQLFRMWRPSIPKLLKAMEYGFSAGEILYKLNEKKQIVFSGFKEFHPRDVRILTDHYEYAGVRIKNLPGKGDVDLIPPKSFWFVVNKEFGGWYGKSWMQNAWSPWFEKNSRDGALDIRRLWFYKNAFGGGIIRYPNKDYKMPDGSIIPARDMAKEQLDRMKTGATIAFPATKDLEGNYIWNYEEPRINGNAQEIRQYPQDLDYEIQKGMGIPDNVITESPGTGSYAGRRVPERAFFIGLEEMLANLMHSIKIQMLEPLVKINFEGDYEFYIETKPLVEVASPEGSPPAGYNSPFGDSDTIGGMFIGADDDPSLSLTGGTGGMPDTIGMNLNKRERKRSYVQLIL